MLDLLIIGGGVHGTALSHMLIKTGAVRRDRLRVLDPNDRPLAEWRRRAAQCGMRYLRSPGAHSIDGDFRSIGSFARRESVDSTRHVINPNQRPSLDLFNRHASRVIRSNRLSELRLRGKAQQIELSPRSVKIETDNGRIEASQVLFCVGRGGDLNLVRRGAIHIYDKRFRLEKAAASLRPAIVGGGIAAAQAAAALAELRGSGGPAVIMVSPHATRIAQYDSDPCYLGPRCMPTFLGITDPEERRRLLSRVRNPGTMPPDVSARLAAAVKKGQVRIVAEPRLLNAPDTPVPELDDADLIALATGFDDAPPIKPIIEALAKDHDLHTDSEGYPVVDPILRWHKRIFMAGHLGELELGPAAGNIIGAHLAARRLIPYFLESERPSLPYAPLTKWWPK